MISETVIMGGENTNAGLIKCIEPRDQQLKIIHIHIYVYVYTHTHTHTQMPIYMSNIHISLMVITWQKSVVDLHTEREKNPIKY